MYKLEREVIHTTPSEAVHRPFYGHVLNYKDTFDKMLGINRLLRLEKCCEYSLFVTIFLHLLTCGGFIGGYWSDVVGV